MEATVLRVLRSLAYGRRFLSLAIGLAFLLHVRAGQAQSHPGATKSTPAFEVASVKPSSPQERIIGMFVYPGGRLTVTNYTLRILIQEAYGVQDFQILGGPKWAEEDRFSIVAKPPADSISSKINPTNPKLPPSEEELLMLRTLLANRFQLTLHEEIKTAPVLALVLGNQSSKLAIAKNKDAYPVVSYGRTGIPERPDFLHGENASMKLLAARLSRDLRRVVLDQTSLKGTFDFKFEYTQSASEVAEGPSLTSAIQELGLKLVPAKGPVSYLVIDRAEKPVGN